ncbi:MAG: PQQ-binding-like beta-propeller repeat protein [Verrucomicrobiota bacterium]|jgi:outer membrane protein assembly factor BamB|nr:PQQ-binding-like beta-propeller repeat protein [Verrucomicrobiota bacterium]MDP7050807.1 PQQ-binding-like beta-propeller repeat protein [Verrucomicrobiota bacterium]
MLKQLIFSICFIGLITLGQTEEHTWPIFRGSAGSGQALGQAVPSEFGPDKNVAWKTALPSGHSSPIIWGNKLFITGHVGTTVKMLALDRRTGKLIWEKKGEIPKVPEFYHIAGSVAAATPATDGKRVVFYFDDYGLVTTDFDGNKLWEHRFATSTGNLFSYGASPIIEDGKLFLNRDGALDSCLVCFDLKSGKTLWKAKRPGVINSYCSPYVLKNNSGKQVLQGGSGELVAYDFETGKEIWKATGLPGFVCVSPLAVNDTVYYGGWSTAHVSGRSRISSFFPEENQLTADSLKTAEGFFLQFDQNRDGKISFTEFPAGRLKDVFAMTDQNDDKFINLEELDFWYTTKPWAGRNTFYAIKTGGKGDITKTHVKWQIRRGIPYVCSPIVQGNKLYLIKKGGFITCVDTTTGKPVYNQERLGVGGEYYATPITVGDRIIIAAERGTVFVIKPSDKLEIIARNEIGENLAATPAIVNDTIYLRGNKHLWAFREEK